MSDSVVRYLDPLLLNTFVHVVDHGGFTAAAQVLHMAQPTVSAHIRRLEGVLAQPLLERHHPMPVLTHMGERVLSHARQLLTLHRLAWQDLNETRLEGVVRLGIPDDYVVYLPEVLAVFEQQFPAVRLEVLCGLSVELLDQLQMGCLDLAITTRQPNSPGGEVLCREPSLWVCGAGHAPHLRRPIPLAVSRDGVCIFRERAIQALDMAGIDWHIAYTSASLSGLSAAVKAGLAMTVMTPSMLGGGLKFLDAAAGLPMLPDTEIAIHYRADALNEASKQLAMMLKSHMQRRDELKHSSHGV
ncbi:LysR family transcriptional regulator [Terasakiispira papahanaumokuakeensis]|uniref:LysR family transcriptional regulator n=1 Tax=Terasakiispira papahanaumokuakeensis TaxID=197479 RepID=A0A1E2V796_9GAMM|nr:LysR substrate-binding domain-containing protein [Terasakiispira papahanaumokuakeensis]ODC02857.1 LysR family transcriptional regulator [Terasakiispira papahanaumokuakeensis]